MSDLRSPARASRSVSIPLPLCRVCGLKNPRATPTLMHANTFIGHNPRESHSTYSGTASSAIRYAVPGRAGGDDEQP